MTTTRVREGKTEHVREHSRRVQRGAGGAEEPNPEDYGGTLEEQTGKEILPAPMQGTISCLRSTGKSERSREIKKVDQ